MRSIAEKPNRTIIDKELRLQTLDKAPNENLSVTTTYVSLKDMPLEERRKEATKPLFITRYE